MQMDEWNIQNTLQRFFAAATSCCIDSSLPLSHSSQLSASSLSRQGENWQWIVEKRRSNLCASYLKPAFNGPQGLAKGLSTAEQSTALLAKLKNFCVAVTPPLPPTLHGFAACWVPFIYSYSSRGRLPGGSLQYFVMLLWVLYFSEKVKSIF